MNKVVKILLLLGSLILMALFGAVAITTWSADTAWQPPDNVQWFLQDNEYARQAICSFYFYSFFYSQEEKARLN